MANLIAGVKNLPASMFFVFVFSKVLVGIGLGILLIRYLAPYGWGILVVGVGLSLACVILALKKS